jgi:uncharacterized protein YcbX
MTVITELSVYPLKSAGGISPTRAELTPNGFRHDRTFMLIRPDGQHLSQREVSRLALLRPAYDGTKLTVHAPRMVTPLVYEPWDGPALDVTVHRRHCQGIDQGDEAAGWFSDVLGVSCRLVRFTGLRATRTGGGTLEYADGYPLLVLSRESLDDLNERLAGPLPMNRFRPNIVLEGLGPHGEDKVSTLRIGEVEVDLVRPCGRCVITTIDQETGRRTDDEPLRTLAGYRTQVLDGDRRVLFGRLGIPRTCGVISVGDTVAALR